MSTISKSKSEYDWVCDSPKNEVSALAPKDELSTIMECPYCLDMPLPPVYLCVTGHIICSFCREILNECGLCKSAFTGTRNFFYENLFEKTTLACKYVAEGCTEVMLGKLVKKHQENCDFRPIPCLNYGCANHEPGKYIAYSKYLNHYKQVHQRKVRQHRGGTDHTIFHFRINPITRVRMESVHQFKGYTFFLIRQLREPEGVGVWLCLLGTEDDAKNFRVNISIRDSSNTESGEAIACWEGPVHSIRKSYESILDVGQCLSTTINTVKALSKESTNFFCAFWEVNFMIKECKYVNSDLLKPKIETSMETLDRPPRIQRSNRWYKGIWSCLLAFAD